MDDTSCACSEKAYPTPYAASPLLTLLLVSLASQKHSPNTKAEFKNEYDFIVVGGGTAGSVVASRISEMPCVSVLLLEVGKSPPKLTDIPAIRYSFQDTDLDWKYKTTPQKFTAAGMKDRKVSWHNGKTLGGSSILNALLNVRGNRRNYDEWAALGAVGWSYNEVLPYFKKLENNTDPNFIENGYHGAEGPVTITRPAYNPVKKLALIDAVLNLGYKIVDPNAQEQTGFYDYQMTVRNGQRCSNAKAYLVPSENRPNLDIVTNAMVRKILIQNKEAVGVEVNYNGVTRYVTARREVIMSAGTVNTPQLLMLSGIGPMSELKKHSIPLVADLPVGLNLQVHPATALVYQVDNSLPRFVDEIRKESNIKEYIDQRTGPLTNSGGFLLQSFLSSSGKVEDGRIDYMHFLADLTPPGPEGANKSFINCAVSLVHPYSIGTVSLHSADPYDDPEIDPNYFADFRDVHDMVEGLKMCNRIMQQPAMQKIGAKSAGILKECEKFERDENSYLRCLVRTRMETTTHRVGTARMGDPKDPRTVVDPQLRVKGINRLRVVDSSVMPTIPWANTNIPTIMVAEKAADIIKSTIQCASEPNVNRRQFSTFQQFPPPWRF